MSPIPARLASLREDLRRHGLTHYLVPSSDEHLNEYLPDWGKRREFASGFTGSAGDLLIGLEQAWLFTDGRYHLQAEGELQGSTIELVRVGAPGQPSLSEHLQQTARCEGAGMVLGYDPMVVAIGAARAYQAALEAEGAELRPVEDNLVDRIWDSRPAPPKGDLVPVPDAWAGRSAAQKLADAQAALDGADGMLIAKLDQLAWLLNLRSSEDVPFNPVFEGYGFVDAGALHVFLHGAARRIPAATRAQIPALRCHAYEEFRGFLAGLPAGARILLDPAGATMGHKLAVEGAGAKVVLAPSPVEKAKAIKNPVEQESMRRANRRASLAKTRALRWLQEELAAGRTVTERSFQERIEGDYRSLGDYWGLSFNTISAAGPHGAIMHYAEADDTPLRQGEMFLIDSGIQVAGGTTDDTRTVAIGQPDEEQRRLYTLVLKAHIAAATLTFPAGAPGSAVDVVCRGPLWRAGLNFDHGTGHGVGCFLNVHEGPFALSEIARKPFASTPLQAGMVTSIEPGYYRAGWGGIRIENLYLIVAAGEGEDGRRLLRFEPLTFIPLDEKLIDRTLLAADEAAWLDTYHRRVREELAREAPADQIAALGLGARSAKPA